jgi:hypothetical protein
VVSRSFVERKWPGEDPLGKLVQFGNMDGDLTPFRIVGVVGDVRISGLDVEPRRRSMAITRSARARPRGRSGSRCEPRTPSV